MGFLTMNNRAFIYLIVLIILLKKKDVHHI